MSVGSFPSEQSFLLTLALDQYNRQYGKQLHPEDCIIYSIPATYQKAYGYEIVTTTQVDYVRLRMYLDLGAVDYVEPYRLEVDNSQSAGALGDEVYVTLGSVQRYYYDERIYRFIWIENALAESVFLTLMSGEPFLKTDGDYLLLNPNTVPAS